jgi:hypothetical protein
MPLKYFGLEDEEDDNFNIDDEEDIDVVDIV